MNTLRKLRRQMDIIVSEVRYLHPFILELKSGAKVSYQLIEMFSRNCCHGRVIKSSVLCEAMDYMYLSQELSDFGFFYLFTTP